MYKIVNLTNNNWTCICSVQDGTEQWVERSRSDAINALIKAAKVLNGVKISESDIEFGIQAKSPLQAKIHMVKIGDSFLCDQVKNTTKHLPGSWHTIDDVNRIIEEGIEVEIGPL